MPPPDAPLQSDSEADWPWLPHKRPSTRWSLIQRIHPPSAPVSDAAGEFCRGYWYPLYCFLRQRGHAQEESRDYVQGFLADLLAEGTLATADPSRGRLWNFLLTLLRRHIAQERRHATAAKRGGTHVHLPLTDWQAAEESWISQQSAHDSPERAYSRALAERLVADGITLLREKYAGREALFDALLPTLEGKLPEDSYAGLAARIGISSGALRAAVSRFRERFRHAVSAAASPVLGMPPGPALEAELRLLFSPGD